MGICPNMPSEISQAKILIPNFPNKEIRKKMFFYNPIFLRMVIFSTLFWNSCNITNGHIFGFFKIMGIQKWAYSICPFLQMGIFFSNGHILPNMPKKTTYGGGLPKDYERWLRGSVFFFLPEKRQSAREAVFWAYFDFFLGQKSAFSPTFSRFFGSFLAHFRISRPLFFDFFLGLTINFLGHNSEIFLRQKYFFLGHFNLS